MIDKSHLQTQSCLETALRAHRKLVKANLLFTEYYKRHQVLSKVNRLE